MVEIEQEIKLNEENRQIYDEIYDAFKQIYERIENLYDDLNE